jgi:hypothetical protein
MQDDEHRASRSDRFQVQSGHRMAVRTGWLSRE